MRTTIRRAAAVVLAAALPTLGCYKATFIEPQTVAGERHDAWSSFFLWGLVGHEQVDARERCHGGDVALVRTGANAGTAAVSLVTLGIYMPRVVYVTCVGAPSSARAGGEVRR